MAGKAPDHEVKDPEDRKQRTALRVRRPRITPEPWERQPAEPERAYHAFELYRDLEQERSFTKAAKEAGVANRTIEYYAQRYAWTERVLAYDNMMVRAKIIERRRNVERMQERHVNLAMLFQNKVAERLRNLDPQELSVDQTAKWLDIAVKIERQSRGVDDSQQPAVQVNIGQAEQAFGVPSGNPIADYLDQHPDRIGQMMPFIERMLSGESDGDIATALGTGSTDADGLEDPVVDDPSALRPSDMGDGRGADPPAEGREARLHDTPVPG